MTADQLIRCQWAGEDPTYVAYHDQEWGVPVFDDRLLFEFLILEGAQAGLSWITILRKRQAYKAAFADFEPEKVAAFDEHKLADLLQNPGIVRNRLKLQAAIENGRTFLRVQSEFGSFAKYVWQFMGGQPRQNEWKTLADIPAVTPEAQGLSKDLRQRGFRFVGPTITYAFMQAVGLVNDHVVTCYRYSQVRALSQSFP